MATAKKTKRLARPKASTSDVVPQRTRGVKRKWGEHRHRLIELRDYLSGQKSDLTRDAREMIPNYSMHMADVGTEAYDRDFALGMLSSEQDALFEIEAALSRIEDGTYGICEMTGKPITKARLEAIPWTRYSLEAERQLEEQGRVDRRRIGELGTVVSETDEGEQEESPPPRKGVRF